MIKITLITIIGVFTGVITGLTPGVHPNTVIFLSLPFYFASGIEMIFYGCFVAGLSVSHTFHDFLPSLFLGLPDSTTALSTVPGLRMVAEGRGLEAFNYSVFGGIYASTAFVFCLPFLFMFASDVYKMIEPFMVLLLIFLLLTTTFNTERPLYGMLTASLSGALGLLAFRMPVNETYVFIPMFSGLFAAPVLLSALDSDRDIPEQRPVSPGFESSARGGFIGFLAGVFSGIVPGIGASIATSFLAPMMEDSRKEFISGLGGVNTADIMISFVSLLILEKARSGAAVALSSVAQVTPPRVVLLMGASLLAVGISAPLALKSGELFARFSSRLPRRKLLAFAGLTIISATAYLTGILGILVFLTSSSIGYLAMVAGDRRPCMAVLIVPAISFFASNGIFI